MCIGKYLLSQSSPVNPMVEMAWKQVPEGQSKVENGFQNKLLSVKFTSTLTSVMTIIQCITEMGRDQSGI